MLKYAPSWVKDLSWEELDQFFINVFQEANEKHVARYGVGANLDFVYDYVNSRWADREKPMLILDSVS
jgi:hypothetical protein